MNDDLSLERAKKQFSEVMELIKNHTKELMKTPEGRASLRRDLAAMAGVSPAEIKFEGDS